MIDYISFPCLAYWLEGLVQCVLNRSDVNEYSCPVPDLRGKTSSLLTLSMMLSIGVFYQV